MWSLCELFKPFKPMWHCICRYYFALFSDWLPEKVRALVNEKSNCEDILMNMLVAHVTRRPPVKGKRDLRVCISTSVIHLCGSTTGLVGCRSGSTHRCRCEKSGFDSRAGQIGHSVANDSLPLRRFFVAVLPRF